MWMYVIQRVGLAILTVSVSVTLLFGLIYLVPGDPASIALGPYATPEMKEALTVKMGLDQPIPIQLLRFFTNLARGDLGFDVWSNRSVTLIILEQLPYTLVLAATGIGWAILIGIPLGCLSAIHSESWIDKVTAVLSVSVIAVPPFVVAICALLFFSVTLKWLPVIGAGEAGDPLDQLRHLILPSLAVGLGWVGYLSRLVRAAMLEVLGANHIRTARAFGLPESVIIYRYALKLAVLPAITVLGVGIGNLISGAVFAEIVFSRPGLGKLIYEAVVSRNYPVVMGGVLVTSGLFVVATMVADFASAWLNPRLRASL